VHLLKLAFRPWRTSAFMQTFSALGAGAAFSSAILMGWCSLSLEPVMHRLSSEQVITAYLDPELAQEDEGKVVDTIRTALGSQAVSDLKLVRALEFIAQVRQEHPDLAEQLEGLGGAELDAVIPRYVSVSGTFSTGTVDTIRAVKGVGSIETSVHKAASLVGSVAAIRWITILVSVALAFAACIVTFQVIKFNTQQFADAVSFMELMGGGGARSRVPGFFSGTLFGVLAGATAAASWYFGADYLLSHLRTLSPLVSELPQVPATGAAFAAAITLLIGTFSGVWAGAFSPARRSAGGRAWL